MRQREWEGERGAQVGADTAAQRVP
jgi:hypothetical protein